MDSKSATLLSRMAKYHPTVKVLVIGKEQYEDIAAQASHMEGWEI
jgi:hypothetical protein